MKVHLSLTSEAENRLWRNYEFLYFFVFSCVLVYNYYFITMFLNEQWVVPFVYVISVICTCFLPILLGISGITIVLSLFKKCPVAFSYTPQQAVVALVCCGTLLVPYILYGYLQPFWFAVLILGAHNIDYKKILRFYFWLSVILCFITFICGITGLIENLVYHRGNGTVRISFGFNYPTDFCSHIFFLVVCWLWLKEEKTTYLQIAGIAALSVFVYLACNARTTAVTLMLTAVWMLIVKWRSHKNGGKYKMTKPLQICCLLAPLIGTVFMTVASVFYSENNRLLVFLDKLTNARLSLGHEGFCRYDLTLFGQQVEMNGNGGSIIPPKDYFFLDCTYINTMLRYGLLTLFVMLFILFYTTLCEKHKNAYVHVGLVGIVAMQCVIEHHLMEIGHTPLLLFLLACDGGRQNGFDFLQFIKKPMKAK